MNQKQFDHINDNELLELFYQSNDNQYLGMLLKRYTLLLFGACIKYLKNETDAKDAVQQVFLKAIKELPKYKVTYFKSWIYMIAKNHCLMKLRSKHNFTNDTENLLIEDDDFDVAELKAKDADLDLLEIAIDDLNEEQKRCVNLFYLQKKSYNEIVTTTGFTIMQVKSHIQNGKRNLKLLIEKKRKQQ